MQPPFKCLSVFPFLVIGLLSPAYAEDISTRWVGDASNWNQAANWDQGIPDNRDGNQYTVVIDKEGARVRPDITNLQISGLQLLEGTIEGLDASASFTVLDQTTISTDIIHDAQGNRPKAGFAIEVSGSDSVTFDLGTFAAAESGILPGGRYDLAARSETAEAFLTWKDAQVSTIGPQAQLLFSGSGTTGIRNPLDDTDALLGLRRNEGLFQLEGQGFVFLNTFTNTGDFTINEILPEEPSNELIEFATGGPFINRGSALIQSNSSETILLFNEDLRNSGNLAFTLSNFAAGDPELDAFVSDDLENQGQLNLRADNQVVIWEVGGKIDNTGEIILDSRDADLVLYTDGGFEGFQDGFLTSGTYRLLAELLGDFATLSTNDLDVEGIGEEAVVELLGTDAWIYNTVSEQNALRNLTTVEGEFYVTGQSFALAGGFTNTGFVEFNTDSEFGPQIIVLRGGFSNRGSLALNAFNFSGETGGEVSLSADGALAENVDGVLTSGLLVLNADVDGLAVLEWPGARIESIASEAGVALIGPDSEIFDWSGDVDALAGLKHNAGLLYYELRDGATPGDFANESGENFEAEFTVRDARFDLGGNFDNSGYTLVIADGAPTELDVASGISNTGTLELDALALPVTVRASGPLQEQVNGTLEAGALLVRSEDSHAAILEYAGARIARIAAGARVVLDGTGSAIRDSLTDADALDPLEEVQGFVGLNDGKDRVTGGDLVVGGTLDVRNAGFRVTGNFLNTGITEFNRDGIEQNVLTIEGDFDNSGELTLYDGGVLTAAKAPVQQQEGVLESGSFYLIDGIAEWPGASIATIGAGAALGLSGSVSGVLDSTGNKDALEELVANDGLFFLEEKSFTFKEDFLNTGEMELSSAVTLKLDEGRVLSSRGDFENGGDNRLEGGALHLLDGGFFTTWDRYSGDGPDFEPIYTVATLTADEIRIDGNLYLELYDLAPQADGVYTILQAPVISGQFDNVVSGNRIAVFDGNQADGAERLGTFLLEIDTENGQVTLSDFEEGGMPTIHVNNLRLNEQELILDWTVSDGSGADVYFSTRPDSWGEPVATGIVSGNYLHSFPSLPARGFFLVLPEGEEP